MKNLRMVLAMLAIIFAIRVAFAKNSRGSFMLTPHGYFLLTSPIGCQAMPNLDQTQCGLIDRGYGLCTVTRLLRVSETPLLYISEKVDAWNDGNCIVPIYMQTSTGF